MNLALQGGGIYGIAHAGVIAALDEAGKLNSVTSIAGTSAGSIVGTLAAMRIPSAKIKQIIDETDFITFKDGNFLDKVEGLRKFGWYEGNVFLKWIQTQIQSATGNCMATFADFHKAGLIDLRIFATCLNTRSLVEFSFAKTPNTAVCDAVRASMSIPWFYQAYEIDGKLYRDGGMLFNYPIETWDLQGIPNPETIGSCFGLSDSDPDNGLKYGDYLLCAESEVESLLNAQYIDLVSNKANLDRSIVINTNSISALDFGVDQSAKDMLYQAGRLAGLLKMAQ